MRKRVGVLLKRSSPHLLNVFLQYAFSAGFISNTFLLRKFTGAGVRGASVDPNAFFAGYGRGDDRDSAVASVFGYVAIHF